MSKDKAQAKPKDKEAEKCETCGGIGLNTDTERQCPNCDGSGLAQ